MEETAFARPRLAESVARVNQIDAAMAATERYGKTGLGIRAVLGSFSALAPQPKTIYKYGAPYTSYEVARSRTGTIRSPGQGFGTHDADHMGTMVQQG